jgi:hypothetical protein
MTSPSSSSSSLAHSSFSLKEHRFECYKLLKKDQANVEKDISKLRKAFYEKMKHKNEDLKRRQVNLEKMSQAPEKAIFAFITFNKVSAKDTVLYMYQRGRYIINWLFHRDKLSIRGRTLRVQHAPEPSTIIWSLILFSSLLLLPNPPIHHFISSPPPLPSSGRI